MLQRPQLHLHEHKLMQYISCHQTWFGSAKTMRWLWNEFDFINLKLRKTVIDFKFEPCCKILTDFFLPRVGSPIARLYSTSTMEHHHFDQCVMILNSDVSLQIPFDLKGLFHPACLLFLCCRHFHGPWFHGDKQRPVK